MPSGRQPQGIEGAGGTWLTNSFKCFHCCHYKFARVAAEQRRVAAAAAVCKSQHFVNLIAALCKLSGRGRGRGRGIEVGVEVVAVAEVAAHRQAR